jgi:1-aminocyclopropane-1-carboxylate deaminase/D-cysteine desulfhydrase-like pyridoxal-dependent ACC family enzyme
LKILLEAAQDDGRRLYVVPIGGSNAVGALGYVGCAVELIAQSNNLGIHPSAVVNATSSLGTQAGLLVGFQASGSPISVRSVNVSASEERLQFAELRKICDATASLLDVPPPDNDCLRIESGFLGPSYGVPTEAMRDAVKLLARLEGILLDPVYTGKAMAWLIHEIREDRLNKDRPVIFLHTGGSPGLFAYPQYLTEHPDH